MLRTDTRGHVLAGEGKVQSPCSLQRLEIHRLMLHLEMRVLGSHILVTLPHLGWLFHDPGEAN